MPTRRTCPPVSRSPSPEPAPPSTSWVRVEEDSDDDEDLNRHPEKQPGLLRKMLSTVNMKDAQASAEEGLKKLFGKDSSRINLDESLPLTDRTNIDDGNHHIPPVPAMPMTYSANSGSLAQNRSQHTLPMLAVTPTTSYTSKQASATATATDYTTVQQLRSNQPLTTPAYQKPTRPQQAPTKSTTTTKYSTTQQCCPHLHTKTPPPPGDHKGWSTRSIPATPKTISTTTNPYRSERTLSRSASMLTRDYSSAQQVPTTPTVNHPGGQQYRSNGTPPPSATTSTSNYSTTEQYRSSPTLATTPITPYSPHSRLHGTSPKSPVSATTAVTNYSTPTRSQHASPRKSPISDLDKPLPKPPSLPVSSHPSTMPNNARIVHPSDPDIRTAVRFIPTRDLIPPRPRQTKPYVCTGQTAHGDRPDMTSLALPDCWGESHDRAMVYLDVRGYGLDATIDKMKAFFPELKATMTPEMLDKRLRQLDQDLHVTYWCDALRDMEAAAARKASAVSASSSASATATTTASSSSSSNARSSAPAPAAQQPRGRCSAAETRAGNASKATSLPAGANKINKAKSRDEMAVKVPNIKAKSSKTRLLAPDGPGSHY